jgi:hypothetical protein
MTARSTLIAEHTSRDAPVATRSWQQLSRTMFIRFVVTHRHSRSGYQQGVFSALYQLEREGKLEDYEQEWFHGIEKWFDTHLKRPDRFSRSSRPDAAAKAVSWFKATAREHVTRMRELASLLEHKDVFVEELRTEKPGYVVYEDDTQVAAVPFDGETF